jgi:hypothetical protein
MCCRAVRYFYLNMRINNFVGAAWRAIQEGGFAVELSLLVGCGLKTHDVNPNGDCAYEREARMPNWLFNMDVIVWTFIILLCSRYLSAINDDANGYIC